MLHEEVGAVLFRRDGIGVGFGDALDYLHVRHIEFVAAGGTFIGADFAFNDHARFLRESFDSVEHLGRYGILGHHALNDTGAVAKLREQQLPALAQVVEPAADRNRVAFVLADFCDGTDGCGHRFEWGVLSSRFSVLSETNSLLPIPARKLSLRTENRELRTRITNLPASGTSQSHPRSGFSFLRHRFREARAESAGQYVAIPSSLSS